MALNIVRDYLSVMAFKDLEAAAGGAGGQDEMAHPDGPAGAWLWRLGGAAAGAETGEF